jgi:azurin
LILVNVRPLHETYAGFIMSRHLILSIALLLTLASAACQGSRPSGPEAAAAATPAAAGASAPAVHDGRRVEITANDTMKFSAVEIRAKAGERITVTLINNGTTPKFSMGHNWILLLASADVDAFLASAAEAPTTDYVPAGKPALMLASTKLLGPGEQDTVTFAAPATPGRFPFLCSYPGHAQVGMRGVLIVD